MDLTIRNAVREDIPALAQFERDISIISFGSEAITDIDFHERKLYKSFEKSSEGMFVLAKESEVCGWLWLDEKSNYLTNEKYVNFRSFYIAEQYRGGCESAILMEYGMDYCRRAGATNIVGKVHIANAQMRALYKQFGFNATHITMEYNARGTQDKTGSSSGEANA